MSKEKTRLPAVGGSSLLVIFGVLCLTVFALLSVSSVQAQQRLGDASRAAVTGYYAADCQAEELLAALRRGEIPQGVTCEGDIYSYACPISPTQTLAVEVRVNGEDYTVLRWQAVATEQWQADDRRPVWDGQQ